MVFTDPPYNVNYGMFTGSSKNGYRFKFIKTDNDYVISFIKNFATAHLLAHVPLQVNWGRQLNVTHARKMNSDEASKVLFHATQKA